MEDISFGQWLSRSRKSMGLTQRELAERVNCATITVRKIEAEQRRPSLQVIERLAHVLNVPNNEYGAFVHFARSYRLSGAASGGRTFPWHMSGISLQPLGSDDLPEANIDTATLDGLDWLEKTGTNIEVAKGSTPIIHDGIFLLMAAPQEMQNQLALTIVRSLGFDDVPGRSPLEQLKERIPGKALLIVVDNEIPPAKIELSLA